MNVPKLRFKEFNEDYIIKEINEITYNVASGKISKPVEDGDYNIYGSMGKIGTSNFYDYEGEKVLVARVGSNAGSVNRINEKCCISDNTLVLEPKNVLNDYLFYSLKHYNPQKLIFGSGQPLVTGGQLKKIKLGIPREKEQLKVANFLSLLDKKIELQTKKIEDLKLFKKGLLNKLVDDIVLEQKCKLSDLGNSYSGISGKTKEDFNCGDAKYIPFMNVLKNNIDILNLPSINICSGEKQNKVKNGDLFFTISSETKEEVGMCATLKNNVENVYLNSFCFGFRIKDNNMMNNEFLCYLLLSKKYRKIISNLGQGFTRVNISKNQLLDIEVEIPSIDVQKKISKTITCLEKHIDLECNILYKLNELKKGLMQNMFV